MEELNSTEYPKHREWEAKVFSLPKIPRGDEGQPAVLRQILNAVINKVPYNTKIKFSGSQSEAKLEHLCRWLRPIGMVHKESGVWKISDESLKWLESNDDLYLTAIFCANVRFIGELLVKLDTPKTIVDLLKIAQEDYKLSWKTKSEINNRLTWFRQLQIVEFNDFKHTYILTKKGLDFISKIDYLKPEEIKIVGDITEEEKEIPVSVWAVDLCELTQEQLRNRKPSIGYIPGDIPEICETLSGYIQLMYSAITKEAFLNYSKETFNIAVSSSSSFITTLTNIDYIERKSIALYESSELAKTWLTSKSALDLVYCIHSKVLFVFELLKELEREPLDVKELAVIAKVSYGFETERLEEIRKRINIFKLALLIQEETPGKFSLTERGKKVLNVVTIQQKQITELEDLTKKNGNITTNNSMIDECLMELRLAAKDSSNPSRFERVIKTAFALLGFNATWLGGSGKTDVLLNSPSIPKYSYTVIIDAKSTLSGVVSEGQIDFVTLKEHKKLHSADYVAVVGFSFQSERLIQRAIDHKVILVDVDSLEKLIKFHYEIPLQADAYKKIFSQVGKVDINVLKEDRRLIERSGQLIQAIMDCLIEESFDLITEGLLQERDIYRSLRNNEIFSTPPQLDEISEMLKFLSSPFIGCIGRSKEGYYALGSLSDAMNKFNFYAKSCEAK
ncbi:hypothetical protein BKC07_16875 [Peribacillus simplex]|nr:hypothetical protein BKC07_16875 [Peribacillus simplex]